MDERYDGGQIAVGQRLAIDALDDIVVGLSALGKKLVAQLPTVLFPEDEPVFDAKLEALANSGLSSVWANNSYGITLGRRLGLTVHGGYGLNSTNTESVRFYEAEGLGSLTLSFELSSKVGRDLVFGARLVPTVSFSFGQRDSLRFFRSDRKPVHQLSQCCRQLAQGLGLAGNFVAVCIDILCGKTDCGNFLGNLRGDFRCLSHIVSYVLHTLRSLIDVVGDIMRRDRLFFDSRSNG